MVAPNPYVPRFGGSMVAVGDQSLFVRVAPTTGTDCEPAVFIHGLGGMSSNWTELMALLADRLDSIAPDVPGFGLSPPPRTSDFSPAAQADVMAALVIQQFGGRPAHVFGNSMGGAIAVQLAARYPDLVRSVTLVSPALPERLPRKSNIHMPVVAVPRFGEKLTQRMMRTTTTEQRVTATLDICYANLARVSAQRYADAVEEAKDREVLPYVEAVLLASLRGLFGTYLDFGRNRPWRLASKIKVPVLLIYGRDDKLVNPRVAHRASRHFRDARVMVIADSGHVSQMEHPGLVAEAWRELIASVTKKDPLSREEAGP